MSWQEIKFSLYNVRSAAEGGAPLSDVWREAIEKIERYKDRPPVHLVPILKSLDQTESQAGDIRILDHGCGSGATLLYLMARGYRGIHGVDVGGPGPALNRLLADVLGIREQRIFIYDGITLPFPDASMDFVFSQQVLEHVHPRYLQPYYAEETRVLRAGGQAYHQVPSRLSPYESHTKTWIIHYLPRRLASASYRILGRDAGWVGDHLFLRWPWEHRRLASQAIGPTRDTTAERLGLDNDYRDYDGPKRLRRILGTLFRLPVVGYLIRHVLGWLAMRDTISVRR